MYYFRISQATTLAPLPPCGPFTSRPVALNGTKSLSALGTFKVERRSTKKLRPLSIYVPKQPIAPLQDKNTIVPKSGPRTIKQHVAKPLDINDLWRNEVVER